MDECRMADSVFSLTRWPASATSTAGVTRFKSAATCWSSAYERSCRTSTGSRSFIMIGLILISKTSSHQYQATMEPCGSSPWSRFERPRRSWIAGPGARPEHGPRKYLLIHHREIAPPPWLPAAPAAAPCPEKRAAEAHVRNWAHRNLSSPEWPGLEAGVWRFQEKLIA